MNTESENVLKALSSSTRRTIMRQISEKGSASYTEIMHVLNLDPSLMSGTFNYHLKELNEVGLIERTNGEYQITDLGKRALILVDQVAKEAKIDKYGVLSAVMSMSPRKELELFMSQMGMIIGMIMTIVSIIPFVLGYGSDTLIFWLASISLASFLVVAIGSIAKMIGILRKLKVGFSVMVFLSSSWFFIRSPNRNSFFVIMMFAIGAIIAVALAFLLPYSGAIPLFTLEWYSLISSAIGSAVLSLYFSIRAKKNANRLEEADNE
ncbi:MAG: ArsR family transcriptional regulator [Candidatus Thorarchaeota archaeon]|nr:MAG: ArsR family transcriptional regulator [Candidatus Thorarchaeota archaeon]